ncbi:Long-chain-fatty-acid--CoA ligase [Entamoeba marina]
MEQNNYLNNFLTIEEDKLNIEVQPQFWKYGEQEELDYMQNHTTYEVIKRRCENNPNSDFMGYRKREGKKYIGDYIWLSNKEILQLVDELASGLVSKYNLKKGDFCGIMSGNRYEWYVAQFAMQRHGIIPIPLYTTLGVEAIDYIIQNLNLKYVFCSINQHVLDMVERNKDLALITFDDDDETPLEITPTRFSELISIGKDGVPKGAVHTFRSAANAAYVINCANAFKEEPIKSQTFFSYLPSAHCFDQQVCHAFFYGGGRVGFISGGIQTLMEDIQFCKPTFFIAVPRVLQKIYDKFNQTISSSSFLTKSVYNVAYHYKKNAILNNSWNYINWDSIVFNKVHEVLGGKIRYIFNGGAPLNEDLYEWLRVCSGAIVLQGYGLTETFGGCCCSLPEMTDLNVLNVGSVCPNVSIRLQSVPDMKYTVNDKEPSGEIQIRSIQNFIEYYHNEEATKNAFTDDGYFCTGDIGKICKDGSLAIIDRKKNLFKLAQGEYIAVDPLENKYSSITLVEQCFIYGESTETFIIAVIVPELNELKKLMHKEGIEFDNIKDVSKEINEKGLRKKIMNHIVEQVKQMNIPGYEIIKNVYFEHEAFSTDNNLMTPSFKLKRPELKEKYGEILKRLIEEVKQENK